MSKPILNILKTSNGTKFDGLFSDGTKFTCAIVKAIIKNRADYGVLYSIRNNGEEFIKLGIYDAQSNCTIDRDGNRTLNSVHEKCNWYIATFVEYIVYHFTEPMYEEIQRALDFPMFDELMYDAILEEYNVDFDDFAPAHSWHQRMYPDTVLCYDKVKRVHVPRPDVQVSDYDIKLDCLGYVITRVCRVPGCDSDGSGDEDNHDLDRDDFDHKDIDDPASDLEYDGKE